MAPLAHLPGARVLEIGAGAGASLSFYPALDPPLTVVLTEPNPTLRADLEQATRNQSLSHARWEVKNWALDATFNSELLGDGFDVVVSQHVLCSVADLRASVE